MKIRIKKVEGQSATGLLALILLIPRFLLRSWVILLTWNWYAVPTFKVAPLTFIQAIGVFILKDVIFHDYKKPSGEYTSEDIISSAIVHPLIFLLISWGFHFFM